MYAVRSLKSSVVPPSIDHVEFSGDFRPCSTELDDDDEDCPVTSGSGGRVDAHQSPDSTSGQHRFIYVDRTSPSRPEVTSDDGGHVTSGTDSLVIVVDMTERSPSRHGRPLNPTTLQTHAAGRPPPYRLVTTASVDTAAVEDARGPAVAERVVINVGLIVGIVGAVSTLMVMLAALLLCRPRPHVAQSSPGVEDRRKLKLSATSFGDQRPRHNIVVHAASVGRGHSPTGYQSAVACSGAARVSTADEWFV